MIIVDQGGIANGRRIRSCTNLAQLHFGRVLVFVDGFGRLELDPYRIIATVYSSFNPKPTGDEFMGFVREWERAYLLFLYEADGQLWAQFDIKPSWLPRYKTAADKQSPAPPEPAFSQWKKAYRSQNKPLPKPFVSTSGTFPEVSRSASETFRTSRDELSSVELSCVGEKATEKPVSESWTVDTERFRREYPLGVNDLEIQLLIDAIGSQGDERQLFAKLAECKASEQWQDARFVPRAKRWIGEGDWKLPLRNGSGGSSSASETPLWRPEDHL